MTISHLARALRTGLIGSLWRRRVPVILQLSAIECGAACLAMILSYYGRRTQVSECREHVGVSRDGVSAKGILEAARHFGLGAKAFSVEPANFEHVLLPAIVHWDFNHFVIVEGWSPQVVEIVDPAVGRRRLTADEFDAGFTGVVLMFEPGVQLTRRQTKNHRSWLTYTLSLFRTPGASGLLLQVFLASLILQLFGLTLPILTNVVVDHVLPFQLSNLMAILGIGLVLVALTQLVTSYLRSALLIYLQGRLDSQLMLGFFEHILSLPFQFFQQRTSGDLMMRLWSNTLVREMLTSQTLSSVLDGALVLGYLAILFIWQPTYGLLVLGLGALQAVLLLSTSRRVQDLAASELSAQAQSQSYVAEALKGIATLKASGVEDRALNHWSNLFVKQLNVSLQRSQLAAIIDASMMALRTFSPLILLWIGALQVLGGTMSLGTMLALNALAASFLSPLASLVSSAQQLQLVGAHLDRLGDVLDAEPEQNERDVQPAPRLVGRIELKNVSFRYSPEAPMVLRDISLAIEPGQKVALVGRTGTGKSTLAMLLLGLYQPTSGEIRYDGIPLQSLNYRMLRSQFGVVMQEPFLFSGSIRENVTFSAPGISVEQVMEAARLAGIHDEITRMPMGYETLVAEGGTGLSGGQRQRLALARALAHRPAVLLLDEATSHLDVVTESLVDQNLNDLHCTRIVIAHRLSTIRNADVILVLDEGTIVERGTHDELLAQGGHYAVLVQSQLTGEMSPRGPAAPAESYKSESRNGHENGLSKVTLREKEQVAAARAKSSGLAIRESRLSRQGLSPGTPAPGFRLPDLAGNRRSLAEFRGKRVLLVFSDPDCDPCQALTPSLVEVHRQGKANNLEVVMISRGDVASNRSKAEEHGVLFSVLIQKHWEISKAYAIFATPVAYVIDENGIIENRVAVGPNEIMDLVSSTLSGQNTTDRAVDSFTPKEHVSAGDR